MVPGFALPRSPPKLTRFLSTEGWRCSWDRLHQRLQTCFLSLLRGSGTQDVSARAKLKLRTDEFFCRASLNKLAIRGIRSFDDKHVQVIEFYSPLTVIVGHNGSGKTVSEASASVISSMLDERVHGAN